MKKNKYRIIISFTFLVYLVLALYHANIFPVVRIQESTFFVKDADYNLQKGDIVNPLQNLDLSSDVEIYLHISKSDLEELPVKIPDHKILYTNNDELIRKLVEDFNCIYTNGDMATCESLFCVFIEGELVYKTNIVINDDFVGLQNSALGWVEMCNSSELVNIFEKFIPVYRPIISL